MLSILLTLFLTTLPQEGTIAFVGYTDATSQIHLLDVASGQSTPLGPKQVRGPLRWSPDGQWLACVVESDAGNAISLVPANGDAPVFIDHAQPYNQFPRWHSSGKKLAYQSGQFPDTLISVYDVDTQTESPWGGEAKGLMRPVWLRTSEFMASALPPHERDNLKLEGTGGLVAVQLLAGADGWTTQLALVLPEKSNRFPSWGYDSPDEEHSEWAVEVGRKDRAFVYESNDGGDRELFLVNRRRVYDLSNHRSADVNPVWSPEGKWVAFESYRGGRRGIYRAHRDSGRILPLLDSDKKDFWSPAWSPDGSAIVCVTRQDGAPHLVLYAIQSKESQLLPLPFTSIEHPAWKP